MQLSNKYLNVREWVEVVEKNKIGHFMNKTEQLPNGLLFNERCFPNGCFAKSNFSDIYHYTGK